MTSARRSGCKGWDEADDMEPDVGKVLGTIYRAIAIYQVKKAGHMHRAARTGMVHFIQRFGSVLNLSSISTRCF